MPRPGVQFLRRRAVGAGDVFTAARRQLALPVIVTALVLVPYVVVSSQKPPPPPELIALGHAEEEPPDPWPLRGIALGVAAWLALTALELARAQRDHRHRLLRLDADELECWAGGRRRHIALQDVVGARVELALPSRGLAVAAQRRGAVVYARAGERVEALRLDVGAHALEDGPAESDGDRWPAAGSYAAPAGAPSPADAAPPPALRQGSFGWPAAGSDPAAAWLVERLRRLVAQRRAAGRPVARCPRRPIALFARREVALGGDEHRLSLTAGNQQAMIAPGAVRGLAVLAPRTDEENPPLRVAELELAPGCGPDRVVIGLDDTPADDAVLEELMFWSARFDGPS